jgi:hypothetical protein
VSGQFGWQTADNKRSCDIPQDVQIQRIQRAPTLLLITGHKSISKPLIYTQSQVEHDARIQCEGLCPLCLVHESTDFADELGTKGSVWSL